MSTRDYNFYFTIKFNGMDVDRKNLRQKLSLDYIANEEIDTHLFIEHDGLVGIAIFKGGNRVPNSATYFNNLRNMVAEANANAIQQGGSSYDSNRVCIWGHAPLDAMIEGFKLDGEMFTHTASSYSIQKVLLGNQGGVGGFP